MARGGWGGESRLSTRLEPGLASLPSRHNEARRRAHGLQKQRKVVLDESEKLGAEAAAAPLLRHLQEKDRGAGEATLLVLIACPQRGGRG